MVQPLQRFSSGILPMEQLFWRSVRACLKMSVPEAAFGKIFCHLLRIFSLSVFYYLILSRNVKSYYNVDELIFLLFLLCASVIFFVKRGFYENGDLMFFNLIICSVPILIFKFCSIKRLFFFL